MDLSCEAACDTDASSPSSAAAALRLLIKIYVPMLASTSTNARADTLISIFLFFAGAGAGAGELSATSGLADKIDPSSVTSLLDYASFAYRKERITVRQTPSGELQITRSYKNV